MTDSSEQKLETRSEIMVFSVNLSQMIEGELTLPPNANELWKTICDPKEFISFSSFIHHLENCTDPKLFLDAFDPNSPKLDNLSIELIRFLNYMHKIIPTEPFLTFIGKMKLQPNLLYDLLTPDQLSLMACALYILKTILSIIPDNEDRQTALNAFAEYLIPHDLLQQRKTRPYINTILFLPMKIIENGKKIWISVSRDCQVFSLYKFEHSTEPFLTLSNKDYITTICGDELNFVPREDTNEIDPKDVNSIIKEVDNSVEEELPPELPQIEGIPKEEPVEEIIEEEECDESDDPPPKSVSDDETESTATSNSHTTSQSKTDEIGESFEFYFKFITPNAGQTFHDAIDDHEGNLTDPLLIFLSSFPHAFQYQQSIPKTLIDQLKLAIQAPDLDLAQALCTIAANEYRDGEHNKEACLAVMALLNQTNYLIPFVRNAFARAIDDTILDTEILRSASQASFSSGLLLSHFENGFAQKVLEKVRPEKDNLPNAINLLMTMGDEFTPLMKFVLSAAFRPSRRKFHGFLVPLNAISSIFMLRYLATELTRLSIDMGKFSQSLTLTLMFSTKVQQLPEEMYPELALFLLNLTHLINLDEQNPIEFELNDESIADKLLTFMFYEANEQKYFYKIALNLIETIKSSSQPMKWSLSEFLENLYVGTDEDFEKEIEGKTFSPDKYTRKQTVQD